MKDIFSGTRGMIIVGIIIGILAPLLQYAGNPGNMGICVACFERDIAGALRLHTTAVVQYLRPEIAGLVLGGLLAALLTGEFRARTGSAPALRFMLGLFAMIGALVFLGCPWRALLRLAGGDASALFGLGGLIAGIALGVRLLTAGFNPGRNYPAKWPVGAMLTFLVLVLLAFVIAQPSFITTSSSGPGSQHAPAALALLAGITVGFLAQRSRFCTVGAFRDLFLIRNGHLLRGVLALLATAFVVNLLLGQFHPGFTIADGKPQPVAHTAQVWNFLGMVLAGLAFTLAGGCPGRQLVLAGEGDGDAAVFVLGMVAGAAVAHNFMLASSPAGPGANGPVAVFVGLVFCLLAGISMREKGA